MLLLYWMLLSVFERDGYVLQSSMRLQGRNVQAGIQGGLQYSHFSFSGLLLQQSGYQLDLGSLSESKYRVRSSAVPVMWRASLLYQHEPFRWILGDYDVAIGTRLTFASSGRQPGLGLPRSSSWLRKPRRSLRGGAFMFQSSPDFPRLELQAGFSWRTLPIQPRDFYLYRDSEFEKSTCLLQIESCSENEYWLNNEKRFSQMSSFDNLLKETAFFNDLRWRFSRASDVGLVGSVWRYTMHLPSYQLWSFQEHSRMQHTKWQRSLGVYARSLMGRLSMATEATLLNEYAYAAHLNIALKWPHGMQWRLNVRRFSEKFSNPFTLVYAAPNQQNGFRANNEQGYRLQWVYTPCLFFRSKTSFEQFQPVTQHNSWYTQFQQWLTFVWPKHGSLRLKYSHSTVATIVQNNTQGDFLMHSLIPSLAKKRINISINTHTFKYIFATLGMRYTFEKNPLLYAHVSSQYQYRDLTLGVRMMLAQLKTFQPMLMIFLQYLSPHHSTLEAHKPIER